MAKRLYTSAFPLVDITVVPDDEIVQHRRVALLELMQKHIRQRDLPGIVEHLTAILLTEEGQRAEALRLVRTMLADGMALEIVLSITGLPEGDIVTTSH